MKQLMKPMVQLFPIYGLLLYLVLHALAALHYPGGSFNQPLEQGYSLFHNFICDLMNPVTPSGRDNQGSFYAIWSHLILSLSMVAFFYILPDLFQDKNRNTVLMRAFGMLTMAIFALMFTSYHDEVVNITALLGTAALVPFFIEMRKHPNKGMRGLAYTCYGLSLMVFIMYVSREGYYYLPFLEKLTFLTDASWVMWVSLSVYRDEKKLLIQNAGVQ